MRGTDARTGKPLSGLAHLRQSIRDILTTPLGSRVMRRNYGSRLFDLVDNPLNEQTLVEIFAATAEALIQWEPRIRVTRVQARSVNGLITGTGKTGTVTNTTPVPGPIIAMRFVKEAPAAKYSGDMTAVPPGDQIKWSSNGSAIQPDPLSGPAEWWRLQSEEDGWSVYQDVLTFPEEGDPFYTNGGSWGGTGGTSPELADWGEGIRVEAIRAPAPPIVSLSQAPPSLGHIEIDLEGIYLPTGQPVFLDGIVLK